jgi:hypothetical protein
MKHVDKQPKRASKAGVPPDKAQPRADVSPDATRGGDKESREPLPRPAKGASQLILHPVASRPGEGLLQALSRTGVCIDCAPAIGCISR